MNTHNVAKPQKRSYLRSLAGREYYIAKRRLKWMVNSSVYARPVENSGIDHSLFRHQDMMLRPLRDVEMYLQHNKITNLRLAIAPDQRRGHQAGPDVFALAAGRTPDGVTRFS